MEHTGYLFSLAGISAMCCWLDLINIKKVYKNIILIIILGFALYCGYINFFNSTDYDVYNMYYNYASGNFEFEYNNDIYDYGYVWFHTIIKSLGGDLMNVYFFTCLISLICYYITLRKYTLYIFSTWFLLFGKYFAAQNIIQIRQGLACAIMLLSLKYVYEKKFIKFICIIFIAMLIHKTVIVALLIYPASKIKWNKIKVYGGILISLFFCFLPVMTNLIFRILLPIIGIELDKFEAYEGGDFSTPISIFEIAFRLSTVSFFSWFLLKWKNEGYNQIFLSMLMLGFGFLCMFSDFNVLSERLSTIFFLAFSFVPVVLFHEANSLKMKILINTFILIMGIILVTKNYIL